ncbi:unnamed protein product, partial [Meganyctiphanes norvegica]
FIGLVHGNQCKVKGELYKGCPVYKIGQGNHCPKYLHTNDKEGKFTFYIKPSISGDISISLFKQHDQSANTKITDDMFRFTLNRIHLWHKITIKRGEARQILCVYNCLFQTYFLEVDQDTFTVTYSAIYPNKIQVGNLIGVDTVSSLWSVPCESQNQQLPPQPATALLPPTPSSSLLPPRSTKNGPNMSVFRKECEKENEEEYMGCPVYRIESRNNCQTPLDTNDGEDNFLFYINPLFKGHLSISLHQKYNHSSSTKLSGELFTRGLDYSDISTWYKIKIKRSNKKYILEVNDKLTEIHSNEIDPGNEIQIETVTSLFAVPCDQLQDQSSDQPDTAGLLQWHLAIIVAVAMCLTLVVIVFIVILVRRHRNKNSDPYVTKATDHQARLSRHVSENSLYASHDNHGITDNQVPQVTTTSATHSANQRKGSTHDSENSLYMGFN